MRSLAATWRPARSAEEVFDYVSNLYALREDAYPYKGTSQACRVDSLPPSPGVTLSPAPGYDIVPANTQLVKQLLIERGPLAAYWFVEEGFFAYDSGRLAGLWAACLCDA